MCLWTLSTPTLKLIEIALNKILRKVWNLPCNSHTAIVHCVAQTHTVCNLLHKSFCSFLSLALSSTSLLIKSVFTNSSNFVYSFTGYNFTYGYHHIKFYDDRDHSVAMSADVSGRPSKHIYRIAPYFRGAQFSRIV